MKKFISTKRFSGFTCCFRQWRAKHTHCSFLHGYAISFKVYFEGDLDENNWVWDFGGMKRAKNKIDGMRPDEWIKYMFDHTVIIAEDDPFLQEFIKMNQNKIIQLRIIPMLEQRVLPNISTISYQNLSSLRLITELILKR